MAPPDKDEPEVEEVAALELDSEDPVTTGPEDVLVVDAVEEVELPVAEVESVEEVEDVEADVVEEVPRFLVEKGVGSTDWDVAVTLLRPMADKYTWFALSMLTPDSGLEKPL